MIERMIEHLDIDLLVAFTFVAGIGGTIWCFTADLLRACQAWWHRRKLRRFHDNAAKACSE